MWRWILFAGIAALPTVGAKAQSNISVEAGAACGREYEKEDPRFSEYCGKSYGVSLSHGSLPNWSLSLRAESTTRTRPAWIDGVESNTVVVGPAATQKDRWLLGDITYQVGFEAGLVSGLLFAGARAAHTSRSINYNSPFSGSRHGEKHEYIGAGPIVGISSTVSIARNWSIEGEADASFIVGRRETPISSNVSNESSPYLGSVGAGLSLAWTPFEGSWRISGGIKATHWVNFIDDKQVVDLRYRAQCSCTYVETVIDRTVFTPFIRVSAPLP